MEDSSEDILTTFSLPVKTTRNYVLRRNDCLGKVTSRFFVVSFLAFLLVIALIVMTTLYVTKKNDVERHAKSVTVKPIPPGRDLLIPKNLTNYNQCLSIECRKASKRIKKSMDVSVDPCVDFYQFACGGWIEQQKEIMGKENKNSTTQLQILTEELTTNIQEILETDEKPEDAEGLKHAKLFYNSCKMSPEGNRSFENAELKKFIDDLFVEVDNVRNVSSPEFARLLGKIRRELGGEMKVTGSAYIGGNYLFSVGTEFDALDLANGVKTPKYKLQLRPAVLTAKILGLPDLALILPEIQGLLVDSIARSWQRLYGNGNNQTLRFWTVRNTNADIIANRTVGLEMGLLLAADPPKNYIEKLMYAYRVLSVDDLAVLTQNAFDWTAFFEELYSGTNVTLDLKKMKVSMLEVQYFKMLMPIVNKYFDMNEIKNYLKWRIIFDLAVTNSDVREALKASELLGYSEPSPSMCAIRTKRYFAKPLTYPYIQAHFDDQFKESVEVMVKDLKIAFEDLLNENKWLTTWDKQEARVKIKAMRANLAYPTSGDGDKDEFSGLKIKPESSFLRNTLDGIKFDSIQRLQQLGTEKKYTAWHMSPLEINAAYEPFYNAITFPAAILQPPLYGNPMEYLNIGAMGSIIGHEITHGFDTRGRRFDEDGTFKDWWDSYTTSSFDAKSQCFVKQYNEYLDPDCDLNLNGNKTLNENIADNGGVRQAFKAYQSYVQREGPEKALPGLSYTPNQMFFISFAQAFCEVADAGTCRMSNLQDDHSPGRFRVKGVLDNFDEFHKAWNCPVPEPNNVCRIW